MILFLQNFQIKEYILKSLKYLLHILCNALAVSRFLLLICYFSPVFTYFYMKNPPGLMRNLKYCSHKYHYNYFVKYNAGATADIFFYEMH